MSKLRVVRTGLTGGCVTGFVAYIITTIFSLSWKWVAGAFGLGVLIGLWDELTKEEPKKSIEWRNVEEEEK